MKKRLTIALAAGALVATMLPGTAWAAGPDYWEVSADKDGPADPPCQTTQVEDPTEIGWTVIALNGQTGFQYCYLVPPVVQPGWED